MKRVNSSPPTLFATFDFISAVLMGVASSCIVSNSKVFAGIPQQALLKAYEEAAAEEE